MCLICTLCREKVVVDKPCVTLVGTSSTSTVIAWNEPWVAAESPTVSVLASDFIAKRLTFQVRTARICPWIESSMALNVLELLAINNR